MSITKAVIPAAGLGTRFLPQTKAMPKEMLPIIDKPIIQLVVEELVEAGVTDIIIVTGMQKRAIEDHFDRDIELEQALVDKGKNEFAEEMKRIAEMANFIYVRQKGKPSGNARPVINAAHLLGNEPFFVLFPDDFFISKTQSRAKQLLAAYEEHKSPVLSLVEVEQSLVNKYGIAELGEAYENDIHRVKRLLEKPEPEEAPSNVASVGGYILTPEVMPHIMDLQPGKGGEIVLADALLAYAQDQKVVGKIVDGEYFDGGNKLTYLKAMIKASFTHEDYADELIAYASSIIDGEGR